MSAPSALPAGSLRRRCDLASLGFESTATLPPLEDGFGQERASEAIRFGIAMRADGYNIFAMGPAGLGRRARVERLVEAVARGEPAPPDRCYVFNFAAPHRPRALTLVAGSGSRFRDQVAHFIDDPRTGIPAAFETEQYRARAQEIEAEFNERQNSAIAAVGEKARAQGIALLHTPAGFGFAPLKKESGASEVMDPQAFRALPQDEQTRYEKAIHALQEELGRVIQEMPIARREAQRRMRELNREITRGVVGTLIADLRNAWHGQTEVETFLGEMENDLLDHAEWLRAAREAEGAAGPSTPGASGAEAGVSTGEAAANPAAAVAAMLRRYRVNLLVESRPEAGAPVVYEDNPTHGNLMGRIEHIAQMGALVTDFTLVRGGAIHRANGGYLILDAAHLLQQPFAWDALKRALRAREVRMEAPGQAYSLVNSVSLEPQPIPLSVKVILVGERVLYALLQHHDPEFDELFKVVSDFEEDVERGGGNEERLARVIAGLARANALLPISRRAVEAVIEQASRDAGDAERLAVGSRSVTDLLREADQLARADGRARVDGDDVEKAVSARIDRGGRVRERLRREIVRGTLLVDTAGREVGRINGLAVMQWGGTLFGSPSRITARERAGDGRVIDIERETKLGGALHSKGVLILSGYVAGRYRPRGPLSFSASLVFEQNYGGVDGDSASSTELYALLSALADLPLRQDLAVTGSVNQQGDVQSIGGVNEKIEGFFDLCSARGLSGSQGVLIPAANVKHLMLREDVVAACASGRFHVYPVARIDDGIELLTGVPAGERGSDNAFPAASINGRVEARLAEFARASQPAEPRRRAGAAETRRPGRIRR